MRLGHIAKAVGKPAVDIINNIRAQAFPMITNPVAVGGNKIDTAQNLETIVTVGEIRA